MFEAWRGRAIVNERVASHFSNEEGNGKDGHDWDRSECLLNLHAHLVLEVLWMLKCGLVEDKDIAERCASKVDDEPKYPAPNQCFVLDRQSQNVSTLTMLRCTDWLLACKYYLYPICSCMRSRPALLRSSCLLARIAILIAQKARREAMLTCRWAH